MGLGVEYWLTEVWDYKQRKHFTLDSSWIQEIRTFLLFYTHTQDCIIKTTKNHPFPPKGRNAQRTQKFLARTINTFMMNKYVGEYINSWWFAIQLQFIFWMLFLSLWLHNSSNTIHICLEMHVARSPGWVNQPRLILLKLHWFIPVDDLANTSWKFNKAVFRKKSYLLLMQPHVIVLALI